VDARPAAVRALEPDGRGDDAPVHLARLLPRVAGAIDAPDRELRATLAASHLLGVLVLRYVVQVEPLASASDDELVALVAPTLQHYFGGTGAAPARRDSGLEQGEELPS
jgi:hypothetical protein